MKLYGKCTQISSQTWKCFSLASCTTTINNKFLPGLKWLIAVRSQRILKMKMRHFTQIYKPIFRGCPSLRGKDGVQKVVYNDQCLRACLLPNRRWIINESPPLGICWLGPYAELAHGTCVFFKAGCDSSHLGRLGMIDGGGWFISAFSPGFKQHGHLASLHPLYFLCEITVTAQIMFSGPGPTSYKFMHLC